MVARVAKLVRVGEFGTLILGRGGHNGSAIVQFEREMVVSCRLSIVTITLSLTIQPQFAIECLRCSNQQAVGHFVAKFEEEEIDRCKRYETMRERDRQTDRQTDH